MGHGVSRCLMLLVLALSLASAVAACKSAPGPEAPVTTPPAFESGKAPKAEKVEETTGFKPADTQAEPVNESASSLAKKLNAQGVLKRINFDFDKYDLRSDAIRTLGDNAATIKQYPQFKLRIEGHCDERGTVEYNLALGEKRARAARDYLVSLGTPARGLSIVSFGKERPLDPGHNESAWAQNRRDEFIFLAE
ncbi:MAG: peptidoglycan-associated lipoprotein [Acidobacteria bacterium 13_1_40CM_2_68_5]|nr:MAG: peptidoglycan-associated lipoprotein [Acidobacteria bacterium 13_1_40CM_2_68_5]OLE66725.1 MAG: peptidoglycan-associated lipoprotein [Acidobacteria bacterium 13_1_20CM_2_68_7]